MSAIACPACGAEFDLTVAFASEEESQAFARLASVSIPLGTRVLRYVALFTPLKQRLTNAKKAKLLFQLLPDLERQAITWKGRELRAPLEAWSQAIDQMLEARAAQRLELPMKSHGYLYAVIASMVEKHEAAAEQKREEDARLRPQRDTVQVKGQTMEIGAALQSVFGGKDPALAEIDERGRKASPIPEHLRARMEELKKGKS